MTNTISPAVAMVGRPYHLYPKASIRLLFGSYLVSQTHLRRFIIKKLWKP